MSHEKIILGAGCFWGVQAAFELLSAVKKTRVGYCGGVTENPNYEEVCSKTTGHFEVVEIEFDPNEITLQKILDLFFKIHNPTQTNGQANDIGPQYLSVIFSNKNQRQEILDYINQISSAYKSPIATKVLDPEKFYTAEEYHQDYLKKNPMGYCHINLPRVKEFLEISGYRLK